MGPFDQFEDLPQIHMSGEESFPMWPVEYIGHMHQHRQDKIRTVSIHGQNMNFDGMNAYNQSTMKPMQRFLDGFDRSPLTSGLLHAKLDQPFGYSAQHMRYYEQPWPSADCVAYSPRNGSPDRTSVSDNSSHTQNELRSPLPTHRDPRSSPDTLLSPFSSDSQASAFSSYAIADLQSGGAYTPEFAMEAIDPREIEYDRAELEPASEEHDHGDMKPEYDYDPEPVYPRVDSVSEPYPAYAEPSGRLRDPESVQPVDRVEDDSSDSDFDPSSNKSKKRRSSASSGGSGRQRQTRRGRKVSSASVHSNSNKVTKKTRGSSSLTSTAKGATSKVEEADLRPFPCPLAAYGCQSTFSSKNEWKRHVYTQHIKLGFWRCDLCATTVDPADDRTVYHNDFNRKDLFSQHLRRMHAAPKSSTYPSSRPQKEYPVNEDNLVEHTKRCHQTLRPPPQQSSCLFCNHDFKGPQSWDERMEHVGRHLEKDRKTGIVSDNPAEWRKDAALEDYLYKEGLIAHDRNNAWKIGDGKPRRDYSGLSDEESDADD